MIKQWAFSALVVLSVCLPAFGQGEQQRWVDEEGVIYYRQIQRTDATATQAPSSDKAESKAHVAATGKRDAASRRTHVQRAQARQAAQQHKQCERLQVRLDRVEQRLADGYREPTGNALRRERRELKSQLFRQCA